MRPVRYIAAKNKNCISCGFCTNFIACAVKTSGCIGCGACVIGCPERARELTARRNLTNSIRFVLDGKTCTAEGPLSVFDALCEMGRLDPNHRGESGHIMGHCGTGGCCQCSVLIDGVLERSCVTPLREGMEIVTSPDILGKHPPVRLVSVLRPAPHYHPSILVHGCNYRCDSCHNWDLTFAGDTEPRTPAQTTALLKLNPETDHWIGISGGEATLNVPWLLETVRLVRSSAPESRIQLDTNASLLTPELIDAVVAAGITDISPDLKALHLDTFMKITGIGSVAFAKTCLENSWNAVRYISERYRQQVLMAVSLPCHPRIHSKAELYETAVALAQIDPEMCVTLIELQPAFRRRDWTFLGGKVMEQARSIVESAGLRNVIIQGGPTVPRATDPFDIPLGSEAL